MFNKEYSFRGKHAQYVIDLVRNTGLFERNIDVYILAPIIGLYYGETGTPDSGEKTTKIFTSVLLKEQKKLKFIFRLVVLLHNEEKLSSQDRINKAFKLTNESESKNIYESYVLGGVEYLHRRLLGDGLEDEEFINNIYEFVDDFNNDLINRGSSESLMEILSKYA
ncbi:MAG: hypothetical protein FH751_03210 [Firmicutes bacterium]|nr:hypothetical protein [Bacillota bacterium]